jgi:hypothetical protein
VSDVIRPDIIVRYHHDAERGWAERNAMIAARDAEYRALNREFGCVDADGGETSSYMAKAGPQYHARYRAIDDVFKPSYEGMSLRQEAWRKSLELTHSEFLFLDSFSRPLLNRLCQESRFNEACRSDLIRRKAAIYVDDWKTEESVSGIYARIDAEFRLFPYAVARCRAFFGIGALNFGASLAIRRFREEWKHALNEAIGRQRLG